ncbi:hypothetical protein F6X40_34645 [Paraburkholderia sp. UCT31]|uniref:hypothetical protein n=1 Tax=Paraburkholderia sp. UCT31 TaxID=2615209 RepID=UPI0016555A9E|nr:hypothetical protein [Paraburkholderia sp. UCT31]MBC8741703.1 hypothetical protein [Paraburkholderia sp. UCT31]
MTEESQEGSQAPTNPALQETYKLKYPDFPHPHFLSKGVFGRFEAEVDADGTVPIFGHKLKFDPETPAPAAGTKLILCAERWHISAETAEARAAREETEKLRLAVARAEQEQENAQRDAMWRQRAEETNAKLNIPVRWTSGQKSVLSGLSENSWGDGRNARSVNHVLLLEPLTDGKLQRRAHDFLCTTQGGSNGRGYSTLDTHSGDAYGNYVSRITCKQCLATAARWTDPSKRVEPELVPANKYIV